MKNISLSQLPSNKKFGFFFSVVFIAAGWFFFNGQFNFLNLGLFVLGFIFVLFALLKPELLLPLNKLWMQFGLQLGKIVNPIVMGLIFYGIFTPVSIFMKLFGRDELRLKLKNRRSHWKIRNSPNNQLQSFKNQF